MYDPVLNNAIKELAHHVKQQNKVLNALNDNLVELVKRLPKEPSNASSVPV